MPAIHGVLWRPDYLAAWSETASQQEVLARMLRQAECEVSGLPFLQSGIGVVLLCRGTLDPWSGRKGSPAVSGIDEGFAGSAAPGSFEDSNYRNEHHFGSQAGDYCPSWSNRVCC